MAVNDILVFEINRILSMINNTIISTTNNNLSQAVPNICAITRPQTHTTANQLTWWWYIAHVKVPSINSLQ